MKLHRRNSAPQIKMSYTKKVDIIATELKKRYKDFNHHNKANPLDELFFILCSVKRGEKVYLRAFKSLKQAFPTFHKLSQASERELTRRIEWGGLQNRKAHALNKITAIIIKKFGKLTLAPLHKMSTDECEQFLCSLPGVGRKVARCVMMYSLEMHVFPIDTHCWRISKRLGWIKADDKQKSCSLGDMDHLQKMIPPKLRRSLHVNMVSLGRELCLARSPKCFKCPIAEYCVKVGVPWESLESAI